MSEASRREALARGASAENNVEVRLIEDGWSVLERNWRARGGELDRIVQRGESLRFVEVKARQSEDPLHRESVDEVKQHRLIAAADAWMQHHDVTKDVAFMVAFVTMNGDDVSHIEFIDDAFDG